MGIGKNGRGVKTTKRVDRERIAAWMNDGGWYLKEDGFSRSGFRQYARSGGMGENVEAIAQVTAEERVLRRSTIVSTLSDCGKPGGLATLKIAFLVTGEKGIPSVIRYCVG
ncbi:MAG: hypothetical protein RL346_568 [Verrucomicrobiota bacterium]